MNWLEHSYEPTTRDLQLAGSKQFPFGQQGTNCSCNKAVCTIPGQTAIIALTV